MEKSLNHHIIDGQIIETSFDNELSKITKQPFIFGITSTCPMIDKDIGKIYKIDIGTSRAFDMKITSDALAVEFNQIPIKDENSIETFLVKILKEHYISRLPQVVHFTFQNHQIETSKIRRALLSKTLIRMIRDNYFPFNKTGRELGLDIRTSFLLKSIDNFDL